MPDIIYLNRCLGKQNGPRKYIATDTECAKLVGAGDREGDKMKNKIIPEDLEECRYKLSSGDGDCIEVGTTD